METLNWYDKLEGGKYHCFTIVHDGEKETYYLDGEEVDDG